MLMGIESLFRKMQCFGLNFYFAMGRNTLYSACLYCCQQSETQSDSFNDATFNTVAIDTL
jgi:hypothetical protein